jgi:hypothetical protein
MIAPLFHRKLGPRFLGDKVAKGAQLALELARLVVGLDPVCDLGSLFLSH